MAWLGLITAAIKIIAGLVGIMEKKQLLDAGEAKGIAHGLKTTLTRIERARNARRTAVVSDKDFRD